jgi:Lar family restriction alleviation protein
MTAELKPCPFCGVEASEFKDRGHSTAYNVGCFNGYCTIEPNTWAGTKAEAIAAWNTRALPAMTVGVKQLREAFSAGCDYGWDQAKHDERGGPEPLTFDEAFSAFLAALEPVTAPDPAAIRAMKGGA